MTENPLRMCRIAAVAFAVLLPAACVESPPPGTFYASYAPPAAVVEVTGVAPGPNYVWVPGHHVWHGGTYVWDPGRYEKAPHHDARWVQGQWRHHQRGWYWTDGRWK